MYVYYIFRIYSSKKKKKNAERTLDKTWHSPKSNSHQLLFFARGGIVFFFCNLELKFTCYIALIIIIISKLQLYSCCRRIPMHMWVHSTSIEPTILNFIYAEWIYRYWERWYNLTCLTHLRKPRSLQIVRAH